MLQKMLFADSLNFNLLPPDGTEECNGKQSTK